MNIENQLRDERRREHDNPFAGRGPALAAAARRRRRNRHAGVTGAAAAAIVAVALLVPGPGRDGPVLIDAATSSPAEPTEPGAPVSICELTNQDLTPGDRSDVGATLTVAGNEVTITLTNEADAVRDVRETGNEVWLVDAGTGRVVAYQADLMVPLGLQLASGETALVMERLALTPCPEGPRADGSYLLYVRGSVPGSEQWLAGPVDAVPDDSWFAEVTEDSTGALRPALCEVPYANVLPPVTPGLQPPGLAGDVLVSTLGLGMLDGEPFAQVTLANTSDATRTAWSHDAEFFLVDRWTMETVGYAADDATPERLLVEPGVPTVLEQAFMPRSCTGEPLPDGWYLLYARGGVTESDPWLAEPTLIGWVDGEPGLPPSDAASVPADAEDAVTFDPHAYPWEPLTTSSALEVTGWMLDVPLSGAWDGADTIQEILTVTNTGSDRIAATVWAWVILVEPDGEAPTSIAVEPRWELPIELDLAPGESMYASAVHWLGRSTGDHRLPDAPLTLPGTYDAYVVLVDAASYDPAAGTGWAYGVGGPFPVEVD